MIEQSRTPELVWKDNDRERGVVIMDSLDFRLYADGVLVARVGRSDFGGNVEWWILPNELGIPEFNSPRMFLPQKAMEECSAFVVEALAKSKPLSAPLPAASQIHSAQIGGEDEL